MSARIEDYPVMAIPTLIVFRDGEAKERIVRLFDREAIARTANAQVNAEAQ